MITNFYNDGQESREFIHISEVARAVVLGFTGNGADGCPLNVGSGQATTVERIALLLKQRLGPEMQSTISGQYSLGDIRHGYADATAIYKQLGFVQKFSFEQGLDRLLAWVKKQPPEPGRLKPVTQELISRGLYGGTCCN